MSINATLDSAIISAFPNYRAAVVLIEGIQGSDSNEFSDSLLTAAEAFGKSLLESKLVDEIYEVSTWRDAFLSFGVKQRVARSSLESLLRRCEKGLPRIDLITDIYNSISIKHLTPIGGENFDQYSGVPTLKFAEGNEIFEIATEGSVTNESPEKGEIIWADDLGATCRRWNWRQCMRTRLDVNTENALFIFDGLGENAEEKVIKASDELIEISKQLWADCSITRIVLP